MLYVFDVNNTNANLCIRNDRIHLSVGKFDIFLNPEFSRVAFLLTEAAYKASFIHPELSISHYSSCMPSICSPGFL